MDHAHHLSSCTALDLHLGLCLQQLNVAFQLQDLGHNVNLQKREGGERKGGTAKRALECIVFEKAFLLLPTPHYRVARTVGDRDGVGLEQDDCLINNTQLGVG